MGVVARVEENPAYDLLVVQSTDGDGKAFRVPLAETFVREIDLEGKEILVELPHGFIESQS